MSSGGLTGAIYKPLSPEQVELIHGEALRLLEEVGMTYESGQDDLIELVEHAGCKVDHLAFEDIREVGPGGNYLLFPHTMRYLRNEYFQGNGVSDKSGREEWVEKGCLSARDRAREITRAILDKPFVPKIHSDVEQEIRANFTISL